MRRGLYTRHYREQAEIQPLEIEAYTTFLAEDRLNQGFTPEVEQRTAEIHRRAIAAHDKWVTDRNTLSDSVWQTLTPEQQRTAEKYQPNQKVILDAYASPAERRKAIRQAVREARHTSGRTERNNPQLEEARGKLETLNDATHPQPDTIAKYLLTPAAARPLYELAGGPAPEAVREAVECRTAGTREYPLARWKQDQETLHKLRTEINNWNLANGMHFDPEQIEQLIRLAEEADRLVVETGGRVLRPRARRVHPVRRLPASLYTQGRTDRLLPLADQRGRQALRARVQPPVHPPPMSPLMTGTTRTAPSAAPA